MNCATCPTELTAATAHWLTYQPAARPRCHHCLRRAVDNDIECTRKARYPYRVDVERYYEHDTLAYFADIDAALECAVAAQARGERASIVNEQREDCSDDCGHDDGLTESERELVEERLLESRESGEGE